MKTIKKTINGKACTIRWYETDDEKSAAIKAVEATGAHITDYGYAADGEAETPEGCFWLKKYGYIKTLKAVLED